MNLESNFTYELATKSIFHEFDGLHFVNNSHFGVLFNERSLKSIPNKLKI